jgi:hypothetical protein
MIRFPVRLAGRQVVSHLVNLLKKKKIRGKCEGWDTPHRTFWAGCVGSGFRALGGGTGR